MPNLLEKLLALRPEERRFAAGAWFLAPAVELHLAARGLQPTIDVIERLSAAAGPSSPAPVSAQRGSELVAACYRRHLVRGECLPRSLVQYALHRRAGHDVALIIGVRPPGDAFEAHAWVEDRCDDASPSIREQGYAPILVRESRGRRAA